MAASAKLCSGVNIFQYFKERPIKFCSNHMLFFKLNYSSKLTNYPRGIIKDKIVYSSFTNVPIDTKTNLHNFLWESNKWMDKTAVVCGVTGASHTYKELKKLSQTFGYSLLQHGFKKGQVIAVILPNFIEFPVVLLSAIAAGLSVCSINPAYTSEEIKHQLLGSKAVGIVTFPNLVPTVNEAISKINKPIKIIVTPGIDNNYDSVKNNSNIILYEDEIKSNIHKDIYLKPNNKSEDLFHISHSSGTTGLPKGIWLSHGNFVNNSLQVTASPTISLETFATENYQDVNVLVLPLYHNFALARILISIYLRSKIILLPKFDGNLYVNTLEKYQPTVLYVVPPIMQYLMSRSDLTTKHTQSLKHILCAGAPLNIPDFSKEFNKIFPTTHPRQAYGLSEATCMLTVDSVEANKSESVGMPVPNTQIKVIDLEIGTERNFNEEGEICFKGPQMTKGYIDNPKANEESIDKDGWFHTGDIGYYDEDGYFYVVDRLKDMIKVKGYQVSPTELEEVLKSHEDITDAAVLGIPHTKKGEAPVAFISTNNTDKADLELKLVNFMKTKVAAFKKIEKFIFIDKIPKTPSGKILRKNLRELLKQHH
ncbi:hypothetical protein O3M35_000426 [Rhynocoris fuscipes]